MRAGPTHRQEPRLPSATGGPVRPAAPAPAARRLAAAGWAALAVLTTPAAVAETNADLIHIEVEAERAEGGKPIDMEFHELERTPELSRARVLTGAGGSPSATSILVLRGFCAIAEGRGARFFHVRPPVERQAGEALHTAEFADERIAVTPARQPTARGGNGEAGSAAVRAGGNPAGGAAADGVFSIDDCRLAGFVR
jgi:hypothetical protein